MLAMIGRDVADELPWVLRNVERLADKFATAHVVLVENDSRDGTASVWKRWAANYTAQDPSRRSVHLISFSAEKGKKDLSLLAVARNKYLEIIPPHVDYLIAVDTDMCFPWRVEDHLHIIDALLPYRGADWDVLYANGACGWYMNDMGTVGYETPPFTNGSLPVYCDLLALRDSHGVQHVMQEDSMVWLFPGSCTLNYMRPKSARSFECKTVGGVSVVPVQAAFGGWAMYAAELFRDANGSEESISSNLSGKFERSSSSGGEGSEAERPAPMAPAPVRGCRHDPNGGCEHVSLSECFRRRGAKQVLATGLVVDWEGCDEQQQHRWDTWQPPTT